jgi:hypothetical protein
MIIETSDNRFYIVTETGNPDLAHVWHGFPVKRVRGEYVVTERGKSLQYRDSPELVRKAATRIVEP